MSRCKAGLMLLLVAAYTAGPAHAAAVTYAWGPLSGGGTYSASGGPFVPYAADGGGYLDITYDPDDPGNDRIDGLVGDPVDRTFGARGTDRAFTIDLSGGWLTFSDTPPSGAAVQVGVTLHGTPGPLTPDGLPLSLDGFLAESAGLYVAIGTTFGTGFFFRGTAADAGIVPEPPAPLLLALGMAIVIGSKSASHRRR